MIQPTPPTAIVIGAGMAGLAAARTLAAAGVQVTVLEQNVRVGGRVYTDARDGYEVDVGAQFLSSFYTHTVNLIGKLGLAHDIVHIPGTAATLRAGRLYKLWPDVRLAFTGLIPLRSKLHLVRSVGRLLAHWGELDFYAFYKAVRLDTCSLADYAHLELDDDALEYGIQPPLASLLYWTPERTSQAMLFLLLKAGLGIRLFTLRHGLQQIPNAMASGLSVHTNADVVQVTSTASGRYDVRARLADSERRFEADGVVCAVPATAVTTIFPALDERRRDFFAGVHYSATAIAAIGTKHSLPKDLYCLFFPRREVPSLASATIETAKRQAQLPSGGDEIVLFSSGVAGSKLIGQPDDAIRERLLADLRVAGPAYDASGGNTVNHIYRWPQALPEFEVGYLRRLKVFAEDHIEMERVVFAGDYLGGPFVEGAISSGMQAAQRLLTQLKPA